jgi:hypothetical protein
MLYWLFSMCPSRNVNDHGVAILSRDHYEVIFLVSHSVRHPGIRD